MCECRTHTFAIASLLVPIWLMIEQQQRPGVALSCVVEDRMLDKSLTEVRKWRAYENKVDKRIQHLRYWINLLHKRGKVSFWGDILETDKKDVYDLRFQKMDTWSHLETLRHSPSPSTWEDSLLFFGHVHHGCFLSFPKRAKAPLLYKLPWAPPSIGHLRLVCSWDFSKETEGEKGKG